MRVHGTLAKWNEERGFGFITPGQGGDDLFVHISAFPRDGARPNVGELISFEVESSPDGKKRAVRVMRPGGQQRPKNTRREPVHSRKSSPRATVLVLLAIVAIGAYGYSKFQARTASSAMQYAAPAGTLPEVANDASSGGPFRCDGRTECGQMTSCAEATYFLQHCPDTKMDGNGDGEPCEQQWCN
ncbi:cold shock domain-containing protein [Lysobacter olei]